MSATGVFYVVQFRSGMIALNDQSAPALFLSRKAAVAFKRELAAHGLKPSKVRKAQVHIHFPSAK